MRPASLILIAILGTTLWASAAAQLKSPKPPRPPRPPPRPPTMKPPPRPPRPPRPPPPLRGSPRPPPPPRSPPPPRPPPPSNIVRGATLPPPPAQRSSPPPPIPTAGGGSGLLGGGGCPDAQAVFDSTNMYRGWHQAPPMTWSPTLAAAAQAYAEVLAPKGCPLIHAGVGGENLFTTTQYPKPDNTCLRAINAWYSEEAYYDYSVANAFTYNWPRGVGHFTAMVWKGGRSFGCGVARADVPMAAMPGGFAGCKIVVCRYSLPVNVADNTAFKQNVLPKV